MAKNHRFPRCTQTGKVRYDEHKDATQAVRLARRQRRMAELAGGMCSNRVDRSYSCEHCGGWHTTSKSGRSPRSTAYVAERVHRAATAQS